MIEKVLPGLAACSELFDDPRDAVLFAEEEALLVNAVGKRRREFTTGRACARAALAKLGVSPVPIPRGDGGAPRWPPGIVGSITHCDGYRAAVVGRITELATVGIDAEPDLPLEDGVLSLIARPDEVDRVGELTRLSPGGPSWDRLLFCAKEAVYKAWFPLTRQWLGFEEVVVTIDPVAEVFVARLLRPGPTVAAEVLTGFRGRWLARPGLIVAAIATPATQCQTPVRVAQSV